MLNSEKSFKVSAVTDRPERGGEKSGREGRSEKSLIRLQVNAMVNKMQGKGFEDVRNYANMRFHFFDIENIHVMRTSLQKLLDGDTFRSL